MAQRIITFKKIEIFFVIVIIALFFVLGNKYILNGLEKNIYFQKVESEIKIYFNDKKLESIVQQNLASQKAREDIQVVRKLNLQMTQKDGGWEFEEIDDYFITILDQKLVIARKSKLSTDKDYTVEIEGIDTYYPINNITYLDIPTSDSSDVFKVYEQEDFLPILGYHYVVSDKQEIIENRSFLEMHTSKFEKQIDYMTNILGCRWFTFGELMDNYVLEDKKIPRRACAINFDDGRIDGYAIIFPVLKKYDAVATFYVIADALDKQSYMSWKQVDEMYRAGNEIGSHTLFGGSLINTEWFERKIGRTFDQEALVQQVKGSKEKLEKRGYKVSTFAYPLGEWNNEIVKVIKESGYSAARDISKSTTWKDPRVSTISFDDDFRWHMYYYKPEQKTLDELKNDLQYDGWWQFEENYIVIQDEDEDIQNLSSNKPTDRSYGVVSLKDTGDKIKNKFLVDHSGNFYIEILGSTGEVGKSTYSYLKNIKVYIDDVLVEIDKGEDDSCFEVGRRYYCSYFANVSLQKGAHTLSVESINKGFVRLDKFRIFREFEVKDSYSVTINEYSK